MKNLSHFDEKYQSFWPSQVGRYAPCCEADQQIKGIQYSSVAAATGRSKVNTITFPLTYINYWTKHSSNDPSAEVQGAAVTYYIPSWVAP